MPLSDFIRRGREREAAEAAARAARAAAAPPGSGVFFGGGLVVPPEAMSPGLPLAMKILPVAAAALVGGPAAAQATSSLLQRVNGGTMDFTSPSIPTGNGWFGPLIGLASQAISAFAPQVEIGGIGQTMQLPARQPQVDTGISRAGGITCRKPKFKVVVVPVAKGGDGAPHVVAYCPPRRMNPLNARALGRAARRLAMFTAIVGRIEKQVQKSFRRSGGRIRSTSRRRCGAIPCRCGRC